MPPDASKELRECLAKGADKAMILKDGRWDRRDARSTAKVLAKQLEAMGAELVFCGRVATDRDNAAVGQMVATLLGWACVTEVNELELTAGGGTAKRETESGVETVEFSLPAVITCNKDLNEPRYAGLKGIMAAKKKPIEEVDIEDVPRTSAAATRFEAAAPAPRRAASSAPSAEAVPRADATLLKNEAGVL